MRTIGALALLVVALPVLAREPVASTQYFAFYSDFETNLNDALIAAGVARNFGRDELFTAGDEQACFGALRASQREGWNSAVDYYARVVSSSAWNARPQYVLRISLAGINDGEMLERSSEFLDITDHLRRAAAPAYEACRWPAQDRQNRAWVERLLPLLMAHEAPVAERLALLYKTPWRRLPYTYDVVETVSWSGANSMFFDGGQGHILIASTSPLHEAFETVFHEASHGFMMPGDPLQADIVTAARDIGRDVPDGLWHVVLFETTGAVIRDRLEQAGVRGYEPMIEEIYPRSDWRVYQEAMADHWPAYLAGDAGSVEVLSRVIANSAEN